MDGSFIERLFLKRGANPTDAQIRQLEENIAAQARISGRGVRQRQYPWGTSTSYRGSGRGGTTSPIFRPSVAKSGAGLSITWQRGHIGGMEPTIQGVRISHLPKPPALIVTPGDFGSQAETSIYFQLSLDNNFFLTGAEPIASAELPTFQAYTAYKLALILAPNGDILHRALYSDLGFSAVNRRNNGLFQPVYWSLS